MHMTIAKPHAKFIKRIDKGGLRVKHIMAPPQSAVIGIRV